MKKLNLEERTLEDLAQDPILVDLLKEENPRVQDLFLKYSTRLIDGDNVGRYVSFLQELQQRSEITNINELHQYNTWAKNNLQAMIIRSYDFH